MTAVSSDGAQGDSQVARIVTRLTERIDDLADAMAVAIQASVPAYQKGIVDFETLREAAMLHLRAILGAFGQAAPRTSPEARENGRRRAAAGVPLSVILEAYRVGARYLWERVADVAREIGADSDAVLRAGSEMWQVLDVYSQELADGYREEASAQASTAEEQRSALFQALFEGHLATTNPWEAAELLGLPPNVPLVVVAAEVPAVARHALNRAERALRGIGLISTWRLLPSFEIGVVSLPDPTTQMDRLAEALASCATGRVGISPPYEDLRSTPQALTLAHIALAGTVGECGVSVFDSNLLGVAAVSAPDVMNRLAATALGGLAHLSEKDRALLLETFGAWLDNAGSAQAAADSLFVHRNTVHHRLRRLEDSTGFNLSDPRSTAVLALAYEIERRNPLG